MWLDPRNLRRSARRAARAFTAPATEPPAAPASMLLTPDDIASMPRGEFEAACRRLAASAYLGDHVALCRVAGRYKAYVDTRDASVAAHLMLDGFWESWLTRFMARRVAPGQVAADVGAHYGYYTLLLADLVGPEGRVVAVEPNPAAADLLRRTLRVNGLDSRTAVHEAALGAEDGGTATLWVPREMSGGAAIGAGSEPRDGLDARTVRVTTLDSLLAPYGRLDFVKIDAEGSEERILAGMGDILARGKPDMVLEFNPIRYADAPRFLAALIAIYGSLRHIDFVGDATPIEPERVLAEPVEWLLFFSDR